MTNILLPLSILAALLAAGCKSTHASAGATGQMGAVAKELEGAATQLGITTDKLNALAAAAASSQDLLKPYQEYSGALSSLLSQADKIEHRSDDMEENADKYFKAWHDQLKKIESEDLRKISEDRLAKLKTELQKVSDQFESTSEIWQPLKQTLTDLDTYLKNDLNIQSVTAVSKKIETAGEQSTALQAGIATGLEMVEALRKEMQAQQDKPPEGEQKS